MKARRTKQTTLNLWQTQVIDNAVVRRLTQAIDQQEGNQIYRDQLSALANLIGKARRIVVVTDAD